MKELTNCYTVKMKFEDLPGYLRLAYPHKTKMGKAYKFGNVKPCSNPYAFTEEKQMANRYGVCLELSLFGGQSTFIRDDGTVWCVCMNAFETVENIIIEK